MVKRQSPNRGLNNAEADVMRIIRNGSDNLESYFDENAGIGNLEDFETDNAESRGVGMKLGRMKNVVNFSAQIDVLIRQIYTATATNLEVAPAALPAAAQTGLPSFVFGNSDSYSGYAAGFKLLYLAPVWGVVSIKTFGIDDMSSAVYSTALNGYLKKGDVVIQYAYSTTHFGFIVLSCPQVAYKTLLTSISSDRFIIGQMRLTVPDATKTAQFNNPLYIFNQTLFGKISSDSINPNSYIDPVNNLPTVVDIKANKGIDKETIFGITMKFDCPTYNISMFITQVKKLNSQF